MFTHRSTSSGSAGAIQLGLIVQPLLGHEVFELAKSRVELAIGLKLPQLSKSTFLQYTIH